VGERKPVAEHPEVDRGPEKAMVGTPAFLARSRAGHTMVFRVHGGSMEPSLAADDLLEAEACAVADLRDGDIVITQERCSRSGCVEGGALAFVVHRLLGRSWGQAGWLLRTRGDNRLSDDRTWTEHEFVGRVAHVWRRSGVGYCSLPMDARRNRWHAVFGRVEARCMWTARRVKLHLWGSRALPGAARLARAIHGVIRSGHALLHATAAGSARDRQGSP
jgi:hypothetical protein